MPNYIFSSKKYFIFNFLPLRMRAGLLRLAGKLSPQTVEFSRAIHGMKNLLVFMPDTLSECLLLQRILLSLKSVDSVTCLDVLCSESFREIIEGNDTVNTGIFYSEKEFTFFTKSLKELERHVRQKAYDACLILDLRQNLVKLHLAACSRAPVRIVFSNCALYPFSNVNVRVSSAHVNRRDIYQGFLKSLGIKLSRLEVRWKAASTALRDMDCFLTENRIPPENRIFCINVQENMGARALPHRLIHDLICEIAVQFNQKMILVLGAVSGGVLAGFLLSKAASCKPIFFNPRSVGEAAAVMERCRVFITANNSLYHLAPSLGVPCVGLFEETEYAEWTQPDGKNMENVSCKRLKYLNPGDIMPAVLKLTANPAQDTPS